MPEISFNESYRQIRAINERVQQSEKAKDWGAAIACLHELLEHPCAHHQVAAYEVWDNIHELHKRAGDYDAAIAAPIFCLTLIRQAWHGRCWFGSPKGTPNWPSSGTSPVVASGGKQCASNWRS